MFILCYYTIFMLISLQSALIQILNEQCSDILHENTCLCHFDISLKTISVISVEKPAIFS